MGGKLYQWPFRRRECTSNMAWPYVRKMLTNFFVEVKWGELDYLLLDLPPGTG